MNVTNPHEIAATVLWDMYNNYEAAERYCRRINNPVYQAAAEIIHNKVQQQEAQGDE